MAQAAANATLPNMVERLRHHARVGDLEEVIQIIDQEVPKFGIASVNYRENGVKSAQKHKSLISDFLHSCWMHARGLTYFGRNRVLRL